MKIPFLPFCIVRKEFAVELKLARKSSELANKQITKLLEQNLTMINFIKTLPEKYKRIYKP